MVVVGRDLQGISVQRKEQKLFGVSHTVHQQQRWYVATGNARGVQNDSVEKHGTRVVLGIGQATKPTGFY